MRVWFNHWFSTAYHLIRLMREGFGSPITVVGSGSSGRAVYRQACDEWYPEEDLPGEAYVAFCLDFCREKRIDVFAPRRGLTAIAASADRFRSLGVRLLLEENGPLAAMLDDKEQTYRYFARELPAIVPEYRAVRSLAEFDDACRELRREGSRLCYKLAVDEGASSFRVLDESIEGPQVLRAKPGSKVTCRAARAILGTYDFSVPLLVMRYLPGADVSVDCLETASGRILLPRFKVGRYSEVRFDPGVLRLCHAIMDRLHFCMPVNIQFKLDGETPYLLEINPRMSGGLQLSCLATGINLPAIALRKCVGLDTPWQAPPEGLCRGVVNLETPIIVA